MINMELTNSERKLIEAVREIDDAAANILLWYTVGLQAQRDKLAEFDPEDLRGDQRRIEIARKHMRDM